jgi:hypothetical protein
VDLLICHLTRMRPPMVCTAGLALGNLRHVRPKPQSGHLGVGHLHAHGGVLRLGRVIRFLTCHPCPQRPEVEDTQATFRTAQVLGELEPHEFMDRLDRVAWEGDAGLQQVFGDDLLRMGLTHAVPVGAGAASLGIVRCPARRVGLAIRPPTPFNDRPQVRVHIEPGAIDSAGNGRKDLPVTDIRFYRDGYTTACEQTALDAGLRIAGSKRVLLALGLTRPFAKGDGPPMHWLQVNGVFPDMDPLWHA